jgi:ribosome biogenesis GTPase A
MDMNKLVIRLLTLLQQNYPERLISRYNLSEPLPEDIQSLMGLIGTRRGCLRSGGVIDEEKTGRIVISEFREGKLGRFTLDYPPGFIAPGSEDASIT